MVGGMAKLAENPRLIAFRALAGAERDAALMHVETVRRQAEALLAAMTAHVDSTGSYADDGHRNTVCWVRAVTNCSRSDAALRVRTARMVGDLPTVGDALVNAHLGTSQINQFVRLHANDRARPKLGPAAPLLIEHGSLLPYEDFRKVCQRFEQFADPDGAHRDHETSRANRYISFTPDGAGFHLRAQGDALSGSIVEEVLARFAQAEFDKDWADGVALHGDKMCAALLARTHRQRRFDAFIHICRTAGEAMSTDSLVPLVNIYCDPQTVAEAIRLLDVDQSGRAGLSPWGPEGTELISRRCETSSGAPVDPNDLLVALLTGHVRRVITAADGRVIDLGRRSRLFRGAAREAAMLAGDRCIHAGCHIRGGRIHLDHTLSWADKLGPTDQDNVGPECSHHNLLNEVRGFLNQRRPGIPGGWVTMRFDGSRIGIRTSPATSPPLADLLDSVPP